jgi:ABC-2 type transport system ATP-binding protein
MQARTRVLAESTVEVRDLKKRYGDLEAVRGVTFDVAPGETFGFLGPNGAGKSTTISMLCTLIRPTGGAARVAGFDVTSNPLGVRRRIGLVFQDPTLDEYLTALENLQFHAQLYRMPRERAAERIPAVLDMVGLWERRKGLVRTFSGGMKRRLEIARGLLHSPQVLFLDEPTVGLDPQTRVHIWDYIQTLRDKEKITIFLTTHYMDEAEYCGRIAIIDNGEIVTMNTPDALKAAVGKDRIELRTEDDSRARRELDERFRIEATPSGEGLTFHVAEGEEFVPRLFAELKVGIKAVSIARPTLDDVFMSHTGRTIRDAESSATDRLMMNPMVRARRGR